MERKTRGGVVQGGLIRFEDLHPQDQKAILDLMEWKKFMKKRKKTLDK